MGNSNNNSGCKPCGTPTTQEDDAVIETIVPTVTQKVTDCGCSKTHEYKKPMSKNYTNDPCQSSCDVQDMPVAVPPKIGCDIVASELFAVVDINFVYPDENNFVEVVISNVVLTKGQPITNAEKYGTLYVKDVLDSQAGIYTLENRGEESNDPSFIGKTVPCGTAFFPGSSSGIITASNANCIELTKDFRIPAQGQEEIAEVSSLAEFQVNGQAIIRNKSNSLDAYKFTVVSTSGTNEVSLRNDGQGGPAGQWLSADGNNDGVLDWCIEPGQNQTVCELAVSNSSLGSIIGCDGNTVQKLVGSTDKQAPIWNNGNQAFELGVIPDAQICVALETCFQVPPQVGCVPPRYFITTSNDTQLLEAASEAVLTPNSLPIVTICGFEFLVILEESSVGNVVIRPTFNPIEVVNFDEDCDVCVPPDCCTQCDSQIQSPLAEYGFTGKNISATMKLPTGIFDIAEYKFKIVYDPVSDQLLTVQYDANTNGLIQAYDPEGAAFVPTLDPTQFSLDQADVCNDNRCPILVTHGVDSTFDIIDMPSSMEAVYNYHTFLAAYPCASIGVAGTEIRQDQHQIVRSFRGPTVTSLTSVGPDLNFGVPSQASKSFSSTSGESERSLPVLYDECIRMSSEITLLINSTADQTPGSFISFAFNSLLRIQSEVI